MGGLPKPGEESVNVWGGRKALVPSPEGSVGVVGWSIAPKGQSY